MPSRNIFRRSTKAPTESSSSIGTKLKESKLAKAASALNQTLHAKQAQFKASVDKNCHKIGSFVASGFKHKRSSSSDSLDSPSELNNGATPSLAPLVANKPEKVSLGKRLEQAIDRKVHSLFCPSSLKTRAAGLRSRDRLRMPQAERERAQRQREDDEFYDSLFSHEQFWPYLAQCEQFWACWSRQYQHLQVGDMWIDHWPDLGC